MAKKAASRSVPKRPQITFAVSAEDYVRYSEYAERAKRKLSDWVRVTIERAIEKGMAEGQP